MKARAVRLILTVSYISYLLVAVFLLSAELRAKETSSQFDSVQSEMEKNWGIKILGIKLTAASYLIDFRYRVIEPEKAMPLFVRKNRPQLINTRSGATMGVYSSPKTGPMRTNNQPQAERNYFILFANPGRHIKVGDRVTVTIDNFKAVNLIVE